MSIDNRDWVRWAASGAIVLLAHAGATAALVNWPPPAEGEPTAALVIELAAIPAAPEAPDTEVPPDPVIQEMQPEPLPPEEVAEIPPEEPPPEPPPPEPPPPPEAVAIEPPPPPPEKKPPPKPKAVATTAPKPQKRIAAVAAAPTQSMPTESLSNALPTWRGAVNAHIQRHHRYPPGVSDDGTAVVSFTINRSGHILSSRLVRGSGSSVLDAEALAVLQRAQPVPAPPSGTPDSNLSITLPVRFHRR